jgi:hypothetical protein
MRQQGDSFRSISAHVAELADACASGAHGETLGGSNPLVSTTYPTLLDPGDCQHPLQLTAREGSNLGSTALRDSAKILPSEAHLAEPSRTRRQSSTPRTLPLTAPPHLAPPQLYWISEIANPLSNSQHERVRTSVRPPCAKRKIPPSEAHLAEPSRTRRQSSIVRTDPSLPRCICFRSRSKSKFKSTSKA